MDDKGKNWEIHNNATKRQQTIMKKKRKQTVIIKKNKQIIMLRKKKEIM